MSTQLWSLSGYGLFLAIVICFIGWLVIKKGEAILDKKKQDILESIEEVWPVGMKEWVEKRLTGTADTVKAILDQADAKIKIADDNIKIANGIINKPAELKLTVNFRGQK